MAVGINDLYETGTCCLLGTTVLWRRRHHPESFPGLSCSSYHHNKKNGIGVILSKQIQTFQTISSPCSQRFSSFNSSFLLALSCHLVVCAIWSLVTTRERSSSPHSHTSDLCVFAGPTFPTPSCSEAGSGSKCERGENGRETCRVLLHFSTPLVACGCAATPSCSLRVFHLLHQPNAVLDLWRHAACWPTW